MTILVTGGAGFIGSHLCEALLRRGETVISVDCLNDYYNPDFKRENLEEIRAMAQSMDAAERFTACETDIRDRAGLQKIFSTHVIDAVIHLAAYAGVRPSIENAPLYMDVNITGTIQLLECMKESGVKRLLFASSSSVYGNNKKTPFSEEDFVDRPISPYAATKKSGELILHTYHHLYDINTACLRFFTVYGPRQRPDLAIYKFTGLLLAGKPLPFYGDGSTRRDYTFVTDTLDGILKALDWVNSEEKRFDVFNLGESHTVSLSEMVDTLAGVLGVTPVLNRQPQQPGDVDITYADITKSKAVLGYDPKVPFEKGARRFVEWYRAHRAAAPNENT